MENERDEAIKGLVEMWGDGELSVNSSREEQELSWIGFCGYLKALGVAQEEIDKHGRIVQ